MKPFTFFLFCCRKLWQSHLSACLTWRLQSKPYEQESLQDLPFSNSWHAWVRTHTLLIFLIHSFWFQSLFQSKSTCKIAVIVISPTFNMKKIASSLDIQLNFSSWDPIYKGFLIIEQCFWSTLEGLTIPQNKNHLQMFPSKISSLLNSWSPATLEEFSVSMIHFCI